MSFVSDKIQSMLKIWNTNISFILPDVQCSSAIVGALLLGHANTHVKIMLEYINKSHLYLCNLIKLNNFISSHLVLDNFLGKSGVGQYKIFVRFVCNGKLVRFKKSSVVIVLSILSFSLLWMVVYLMPMTFQVDFNDPNFKTPAEPDDIFLAFSGSGFIFTGSKLVTFTKVLHHYRPQFGTVCSVPFGHLGWVF